MYLENLAKNTTLNPKYPCTIASQDKCCKFFDEIFDKKQITNIMNLMKYSLDATYPIDALPFSSTINSGKFDLTNVFPSSILPKGPIPSKNSIVKTYLFTRWIKESP